MSLREVKRVLSEFAKQKLDPKSAAATNWLAANLSKIQTQIRSDYFNRSRRASTGPGSFKTGSMLFFSYNPKHKDKLDFWDEYPLIILLKKRGNSILGLNLHYLSPRDRARFLNYLIQFVDNPEYHKSPPSYMNISYVKLIRSKLMRHCIKRYLISSIQSKVNMIPSNEWKVVSFLPIQRFRGGSNEQAWAKDTK